MVAGYLASAFRDIGGPSTPRRLLAQVTAWALRASSRCLAVFFRNVPHGRSPGLDLFSPKPDSRASARYSRRGDDSRPSWRLPSRVRQRPPDELLAAARALKERYRPGVITYSRKVFLPLTNLCRDYCGYCTFRRDPGEPGAHTMTPDEVLAVAQQGEKLGCTEALFSLGDKPEMLFPEMRETLRRLGYRSTLHYLEAMCELVLRETRLLPHANPGLLSANGSSGCARRNPSLGLMLESTSTHCSQAHPAGRLPTSCLRCG